MGFWGVVEDKGWYNDKTFWQQYLSMLVAQRFNRFALAFGIGYDFTSRLRDTYFHFAYPFLVSVPGYEVRVPELPDAERDHNLEMLIQGNISCCSTLVREASIQAGGLVAVARNPVHASWLKQSAAVGAVQFTIALGREFLAALRAGKSTSQAVGEHLHGEIVSKAKVISVELTTRGGFDVGRIVLETGLELVFLNEYITAETDGARYYTFPDLITTFDTDTGDVVNTSDVKKGMHIEVMAAGRQNLILGEGMRDRDLFLRLETILNKPVIRYVFEGE